MPRPLTKKTREKPTFDTEAALCRAFQVALPDEWVCYPETAGWDMVLVHRVGGWQIGVEAKLTLNAKVLVQALSGLRHCRRGPDFRAVLVGKVVAENAQLARALGITVITPKPLDQWRHRDWRVQGPAVPVFHPMPPKAEALEKINSWWSDWHHGREWMDCFPAERLPLPQFIPDVAAGVPSPMILSEWKIKAMRVCVWVERNEVISRAQFKALGIDPTRWMNGHWLEPCKTRGQWKAGRDFPADKLRREHPAAFDKINASYGDWSQKVPKIVPVSAQQESLL